MKREEEQEDREVSKHRDWRQILSVCDHKTRKRDSIHASEGDDIRRTIFLRVASAGLASRYSDEEPEHARSAIIFPRR